MKLPKSYEEVPYTLRIEIEEAFGIYFKEEFLEDYLRGVVENDYTTLDEIEHETFKFFEEYYLSRLNDEF